MTDSARRLLSFILTTPPKASLFSFGSRDSVSVSKCKRAPNAGVHDDCDPLMCGHRGKRRAEFTTLVVATEDARAIVGEESTIEVVHAIDDCVDDFLSEPVGEYIQHPEIASASQDNIGSQPGKFTQNGSKCFARQVSGSSGIWYQPTVDLLPEDSGLKGLGETSCPGPAFPTSGELWLEGSLVSPNEWNAAHSADNNNYGPSSVFTDEHPDWMDVDDALFAHAVSAMNQERQAVRATQLLPPVLPTPVVEHAPAIKPPSENDPVPAFKQVPADNSESIKPVPPVKPVATTTQAPAVHSPPVVANQAPRIRVTDKQVTQRAQREADLTGVPVEQVKQRIQENVADCTHAALNRMYLPGICDVCHDSLDKYLYRGCACSLEVCKACLEGDLQVTLLVARNTRDPLASLRFEFLQRPSVLRLGQMEKRAAWLDCKNRLFTAGKTGVERTSRRG